MALFGGIAFGDSLQKELQRFSVGAPGAELIDAHVALLPFDKDTVFLKHFSRVLDGATAHFREEIRDLGDVGLSAGEKVHQHAFFCF